MTQMSWGMFVIRGLESPTGTRRLTPPSPERGRVERLPIPKLAAPQGVLPILVPVAGLEPVRCCQRGILSPLCLPIPPSGRGLLFSWQLLRRQGAGVARRGPSRYTARGSAVTGEARQGGTFSYDSALSGSCRTPAPVGAEGRESSSGHVPRPSRTVRQL